MKKAKTGNKMSTSPSKSMATKKMAQGVMKSASKMGSDMNKRVGKVGASKIAAGAAGAVLGATLGAAAGVALTNRKTREEITKTGSNILDYAAGTLEEIQGESGVAMRGKKKK